MKRTWIKGFGLAIGLIAANSGQSAMAQVPAPANLGMPSAAMMANPYLNPYMNPYLNPMAAQQRISPGNAALYMYAANSANGGIGSGRISGTRPGPVAAATGSRSKAAEMPNGSSVPGSGAARFFNPGPVNVNGAGRYHNRRNTYFQNNGR